MLFKNPDATLLLRIPIAIILVMHSVPGIFDGSITDFGSVYLNNKGFAPFGPFMAWAIKLSHILAAACFVTDRFVKLAGWITIFVLAVGIFMVHLPDGWFVVGGGRNGIEFNFLLIFVILYLMYGPGSIRNIRLPL